MDKDLTPLGSLLEAAREARRPKLSQNALAQAAETSPTTYRRVIRGIARLGGRDVPFDGSPDSIARIAQVLDVTPEQLEEVDRADVAAELRELLKSAVVHPDTVHGKARIALPGLQATAKGVVSSPDPLADLPEDPEERRVVLTEMLDQRARENAELAAELARLMRESG